MLCFRTTPWAVVTMAMLAVAFPLGAADHGPVFGLATPTNPQGEHSPQWGFQWLGLVAISEKRFSG